jgi:hypothetical protein
MKKQVKQSSLNLLVIREAVKNLQPTSRPDSRMRIHKNKKRKGSGCSHDDGLYNLVITPWLEHSPVKSFPSLVHTVSCIPCSEDIRKTR